MNLINVAVIGYGNIGKFAVDAVLAAEDMTLAGIVRRNAQPVQELPHVPVSSDIKNLGDVDVAILCTPSRSVLEEASKYLKMGINTVDSFDVHSSIWDLKQKLSEAAIENSSCAIISSGWDPGSDSIVRALLDACAPKGITYTNFGPGMSMGHSVAAKGKTGVKDALSMTIPVGTGLHRRVVYIEMENGGDFEKAKKEILEDPYFSHDDSHIILVDSVRDYLDRGHGVSLTRKGVSGYTDNQLFEFNMKINNPALTAQIMCSSARAAMKQKPGAYTLIEIPVIDLLPGDKESLIKKLV